MGPTKVEAILNWPLPQNIKEITKPLNQLTQKDTPWDWDSKCQSIFLLLKKAFTSALILCHFNPFLPIVLECNASDYAIARILSQLDSGGKGLCPVAFYTHSMIPMELNYNIYDKELLTIVKAFCQWQAYLEESLHHIQNDWHAELPLAKFTYNNTPHSTTRVSSFYANKGYNPQLMLSLKNSPSHVIHKVAKDLQSLHQFLQNKINTANQAYSKHANTQLVPQHFSLAQFTKPQDPEALHQTRPQMSQSF
ncbi:hypothetical protein E4T56_gene2871 [Termitomyces sp. T112]|nr:hypothetical protein E4T56_gene2871 [Termitomyces sp. T112]